MDKYQPQCVQNDITGLVPLAYGVALLVTAYVAVRAIFLLLLDLDVDAGEVACPAGVAARSLVALLTFGLAALMHILCGYVYFRSRRDKQTDEKEPSPGVRVVYFMSGATIPGMFLYTAAIAFFPC
ncbi:hypothetical protein A6U87_24375 [Rhizobium sp. AC44/96]|uniref:hypothetical protein n=1 Tax=Rhizobium sp. AC44/96 TaxID=1841654 RepID=UPI00080FA559|nr:hypothetical protein [Rhizobium sp. AC44/96]OCJ15264.1 hypothetical protein A6U87_24375 [Rhizobium sp. AC44/96]